MKKFNKILFCSLALVPAIALVGCNDPQYFSITTLSSNELLGKASGGSEKSFIEGSEVVLSAQSYAGSNFLCWIHSSNRIVSKEANIKINVSQATSGSYTALFEEEAPSSMMYAMASEMNFISADYDDVSKVTYLIEYSSSDNAASYKTLCSGTYDQIQSTSIKSDNVLYLGKAGNLYKYNFRVTLSSVTYLSNNFTSNIGQITFDDEVSTKTFDKDGNITLSASHERGTLTFTLSKLTSSLLV